MIFYSSVYCENAIASVGNTFKKMNVKYHMKPIPINNLFMYDPYLINFSTNNSGVKAYKFKYKGAQYKAVFNYNNICWEEFAIFKNNAPFPLRTLIGKTLSKYPVYFKVVTSIPFQYERLVYGRSIGKVIYIIQYINSNLVIEDAVMPAFSPDGGDSLR